MKVQQSFAGNFGRTGHISSLASSSTNLLYSSSPSRPSTLNEQLAIQNAQQQYQQRQLRILQGDAFNDSLLVRQALGLSAVSDLAAAYSLNHTMCSPGLLDNSAPWNALSVYRQQQERQQYHNMDAFNPLIRMLPSPGAPQDKETLEFMAREMLMRSYSSGSQEALGCAKVGSGDVFLPPNASDPSLSHTALRLLSGSENSVQEFEGSLSEPFSRGQKRTRSDSSAGLTAFSPSKRPKSTFDTHISKTKRVVASSQLTGSTGGIAKFKKSKKVESRSKRSAKTFSGGNDVKILKGANDGGDIHSSKSRTDTASPLTPNKDSSAIRFFNNGSELDTECEPRTALDDGDVDSKVNSDVKDNEISELCMRQKSIWDELTSGGVKSKRSRKRKKITSSISSKLEGIMSAGEAISSNDGPTMNDKSVGKERELYLKPRELHDSDMISNDYVKDLARDATRELENTLGAASVLMDFLTGGAKIDSKNATQA